MSSVTFGVDDSWVSNQPLKNASTRLQRIFKGSPCSQAETSHSSVNAHDSEILEIQRKKTLGQCLTLIVPRRSPENALE
ncbi:hypothetical protein J2P12_08010, partial [Candidatus Bathyarchaeota archaeon]|nr:hypothetical protein [Candidatus Bathyarchaeota archaeon]